MTHLVNQLDEPRRRVGGHDLLFPSRWGTPLDPRLRAFGTVVEQVNTARAAHGWAALGRVGLHTLRHTCASPLLAQQREAAQRMHAALRW